MDARNWGFLYTMYDWEKDGTLKVHAGQCISKEVFNELKNSVPPETLTKEVFQVGEPYSHDDKGTPQYTTFLYEETDESWMFVGYLPTWNIVKEQIKQHNHDI